MPASSAPRSGLTSSSSVSCSRRGPQCRHLLSHLGEVLVSAFLVIYGLGISELAPMTTPFIERDPTISQPMPQKGDTVPNTVLGLIAIVFPFLTAIALTAGKVLLWDRCGRSQRQQQRSSLSSPPISFTSPHLWWTVWWHVVALAQSAGVALSATNTIKNVAARQRPAFFEIVNYAGYEDALDSGNFAAYNQATTAGAIGDIAKAQAPLSDIYNGQRSFPSGHSSLSFAGMVFLTGYFRWLLRVPKGNWFGVRAFLSCSPLVLAAWIAISRVRDRKHNPDDISVGAIIGAIGGILAWIHYESVRGERDFVSGGEGEGADGGISLGGKSALDSSAAHDEERAAMVEGGASVVVVG